MPRTFDRICVAPGIYQYPTHYEAVVRMGAARAGKQQRITRRFPLDTAIPTMQGWRCDHKETLIDAQPAAPSAGSLTAIIGEFVAALPAGQYKADSVAILEHWIQSPLGKLPAMAISRSQIVTAISRMTDADPPAAASTCNRRLSRLRRVYQEKYGIATPNPTDGIKYLPEPKGEIRGIPVGIVKSILEALPDLGRADRGETRPAVSLTKIRLEVMFWAGIPPATLRRVRPGHVELENARVYLMPRRKGKGMKYGSWISLLPEGVEALRRFAAAGLYGRPWSRSSMWKTWHVAIARAKAAAAARAEQTGDRSWVDHFARLPLNCRPYDLRHSFATELYLRTGDIGAVSEILQHADLETTRRYTRGAVSARVQAAIATAAAAFTAAPSLPPPPSPIRLVPRRA